MDGKGSINPENKDHDVTKGIGIYWGPSGSGAITAIDGELEFFHLVVQQIPG